MHKHLATAIALCTLGIAGCATDPKAATSQGAPAGEVITGSRIPRSAPPEQSVRSISGDAWRRESSSVIGNQPLGN